MYNDKLNAERISGLHPRVQVLADKFLELCDKAGYNILITSGYRSIEEQNKKYAQGRTTAGGIITNAKGGSSYHNYRLAFDFVPIKNNKADWDDLETFRKIGAIGKSVGLEWGGDFKTIVDMPHFQYSGGLSISQLKAGAKLPEASKPVVKPAPVIKPTPVKVTKPAIVYGEVTASALNVRNGKTTNAKVIGVLKKGEKIKLDKKIGDWYSIYYGTNGGFVSAKYIKIAS